MPRPNPVAAANECFGPAHSNVIHGLIGRSVARELGAGRPGNHPARPSTNRRALTKDAPWLTLSRGAAQKHQLASNHIESA